MAKIFSSSEAAKSYALPNGVLISAPLRNPVRYPSMWVDSSIFANLAHVPEQYRELLRAIFTERIENLIREAVKAEQTSIDDALLTEASIISGAVSKASTRLTKEEFMAAFRLSILGAKVKAMARTNPAMAQQMEDSIAACATPRGAAALNETRIAQLLTVLAKQDYAADAESQWYLQALASIERASANRNGADLDSVF